MQHIQTWYNFVNYFIAKSSTMQTTILPLDLDAALNSTLTTHITNGKRTPRDLSGTFEERSTIFDDTKNNNNGNTLSRLNNALVPKVAHQSAKSKIVVSEPSSLTSRNLESLDFLGNNCFVKRIINTFIWTDTSRNICAINKLSFTENFSEVLELKRSTAVSKMFFATLSQH